MASSRRRRTPPPCDPHKRPFRPADVHWSEALTFAMTDPDQVLEEEELTVTLGDGFPKARYHYLIVPREDIMSITDLRPGHLALLRHMHSLAEGLVSRVCAKEPDRVFRLGYHAVPSLKRLHLHVISQDFDSPRMRNKHQWNTFNTKFFIESEQLIEVIERDGRIQPDKQEYEDLLRRSMKCNLCPELFDDIDKLNRHRREVHDVAHTTAHPILSPTKPSHPPFSRGGRSHHRHHGHQPYHRGRRERGGHS